jgi:carbamoyl-phosphate synthase large subunit
VFLSVRECDKPAAAELARSLAALGFDLLATDGTASYLNSRGLATRRINKVLQGRPHCEDAIINGDVQMIINTTEGAQAIKDSFSIRRSALMNNVPHYTTIAGAAATVDAIAALKEGDGLEVAPLQSYFTPSF